MRQEKDRSDAQTVVLGMGVSGISAASLLLHQGRKVLAMDQNFDVLLKKEEIHVLQENKNFSFLKEQKALPQSVDQLVVSPGISLSHGLIQEALQRGIEVIGEMELGLRSIKNPCIGITGSNGKTTTTLLTAHVLNANGKEARTLGNIGTGICSYALNQRKQDILVLEISSFQLKLMKTQSLDCALILNIFPNHIDWHGSMEDYAKTKCGIQKFLKKNGSFYLSHDVQVAFGFFLKEEQEIIFDDLSFIEKSERLLKIFETPLGDEQKQNILAAYHLCRQFGVDEEGFCKAYASFKKPSHRVEFVREVRGVAFYNDSKATNTDAVIHAVNFMKGPVILIAGGTDKGLSYVPWKKAFKDKVKQIILIGATAEKMAKELEGFPLERANSLDQAVKRAYVLAQEHDHVLLSPGCSSFDMFQNYEQRGNEFKRLVGEIMQ